VEDLSMKVGLLMEAAESQQALAAAALERLREHAAAIDGIVREEIRSTLIEELAALEEDSRRAAQSLRALKQAASARLAAWSVGLTALSASIPFGAGWWLLPSRAEVATLRATRDELSTNIAQLTQQGGRVELRHCGAARRLCVHVDRGAPPYGEASDYLVVKGY
jgi:Tfp pilus assembly protein PilN